MADQVLPGRQYEPKDTIGFALKATGIATVAGTFFSTIQNTLTRQNVGAFGFLTRTGGSIAVFAASGGAYEFVRCASANLREKDDTWNYTWGGLAAGSVIGLRARSAPAIVGYGVGLAVVLSAFAYTGGHLSGEEGVPFWDEISRKEYLRKSRRRPIEQTINELGEGRGIYAPGYTERRAERLKANYGVDVPAS